MKNNKVAQGHFVRFGTVTVGAVYFLILIGGIVRSTGAGMGCPDWPKCFGQWVPPTEVNQLPENYQEIYAERRRVKNERVAAYFDRLGFERLSYQIAHDPSLYDEAEFNAAKTWIEYVNRLVGALIGLFIIGTFVVSWRIKCAHPRVRWWAGAALVGVLFQGWLGSVVVSTNLLPWMITLHMLLAIAIVGLLIRAVVEVQRLKPWRADPVFRKVLIVSMGLTVVQIVLGTQVREAINEIADFLPRSAWVDNLGARFEWHRSFSWALLLANSYLLYRAWPARGYLRAWTVVMYGTMMMGMITGIGMAYAAVPAFLQPIHLLVATVLIGMQLYVYWRTTPTVYISKRKHNQIPVLTTEQL